MAGNCSYYKPILYIGENMPTRLYCAQNYFQRYGGFGWGGSVITYTIGFMNGHRLLTWKNPAENLLELCDVMLNSGCEILNSDSKEVTNSMGKGLGVSEMLVSQEAESTASSNFTTRDRRWERVMCGSSVPEPL